MQTKSYPKPAWVITKMDPKPDIMLNSHTQNLNLKSVFLVQMQMLSCIAWLIYLYPKLVHYSCTSCLYEKDAQNLMCCRNRAQNWYIVGLYEKHTQNWRDCRNQTQNRGSHIPVLNLRHLHPQGLKEGCNLSPLLFNIFIDDMEEIFDQEKTCEEVSIDGTSLIIFLCR